MNPEAVQTFSRPGCPNLREIANESEKLITYVASEMKFTRRCSRDLLGSRQAVIWELTDARHAPHRAGHPPAGEPARFRRSTDWHPNDVGGASFD